MNAVSIGDALFTKTQQSILGLLYANSNKRYYTNEILRITSMGTGTITRELQKMVAAELLTSTKDGNQNYYQANKDNPIFNELVGIVRKTFGMAEVIQQACMPMQEDIEYAFIYGSIAKGEDTANSDIDLLIISELTFAEVMNNLAQAEQTLARKINPSIYTKKQIKTKIKQKNSFVTRILDQPKLWVLGTEDELRKFR